MPDPTIKPATKNTAQRPLVPASQAIVHTKRNNAEDAESAATEFLLDHVGNQLLAGQPYSMLSAIQATLLVLIHLAYVHTACLAVWVSLRLMKRVGRL